MARLLLKHRIPMVILNACQSGKYINKDESSLGSLLIQAGVQTVLAVSYSVTVSAAELLMPVLYRQLLRDISLSSALHRLIINTLGVTLVSNVQVLTRPVIEPEEYLSQCSFTIGSCWE